MSNIIVITLLTAFTTLILSIASIFYIMYQLSDIQDNQAKALEEINNTQIADTIRYCESKFMGHTTYIDHDNKLAVECSKTIQLSVR